MNAPSAEEWNDPTRTLCHCHNVSAGRVREIIRASGADSLEAVSRACKAGTGCKSCLPDIATVLQQERALRPHVLIRLWRRLVGNSHA